MKIMLVSAIAIGAALTSTGAMAQSSDYAGAYVGVVGGVTLLDDDETGAVEFDRGANGSYGENVTTGAGANAFSPGFCGGTANSNAASGGCSDDDNDYEFGVRAGVDFPLGTNFIGGVVLEGMMSNVSDSATAFSTTPANYTFTREIDYTAAARARLGFTPGFGLVYVTGGLGAAKMDNSFSSSNTANSFTQNNASDWSFGYQAGGGVEFGLGPSLRLGAEYLYNDFDNDDYYVSVGTGTAPATNPFVLAGGVNMRPVDSHVKYHSIRATLTFGF